jgi:GNAT superfamily N-acetyltransferase
MIRKATIKDVRAMNHLRLQVRENVLSDPALVTSETTAHAITAEGRGWVYEEAGEILGFAIAKDEDPTIWALFVHPHHEGLGIGHFTRRPWPGFGHAAPNASGWARTRAPGQSGFISSAVGERPVSGTTGSCCSNSSLSAAAVSDRRKSRS